MKNVGKTAAVTLDQFSAIKNPELVFESENSEINPQKSIAEILQFVGGNLEQILKNPAVKNLLTTVGGNVEQIVAFLCKDRKIPPKKKKKNGHKKVKTREAERKRNNNWAKGIKGNKNNF